MIILDRSNAPHVVLTFPPEPGFPDSLAWTPDGKRLRFTTAERSGVKLSSVSLHGDVRALYRFPEHRFLEDIAPDGTMIFIAWDAVGRIGLMRPGQPSHRELAWLGFPGIMDLSPDGRTVLFYDGPLVDPQAVLEATDGTPPKVLGAGYPLALSPDGRRVAMTSRDQHGLSLVPTGAGTTEEVPVSGLVVGVGQWSHDGGRLWITARQKDQVRVQLFPVDVVSRKLLEPIAGSNVSNAPIAISPDDQWIAAVGADGAVTVYPIQKGEPVRISSVRADLFPNLAGWTTTGELWVFLAGATPPRLVRVEVHSGKITQSIDLDRRQIGADEIVDVRITPDESLLAVEYGVWRGPARADEGHPGRPLTSTGAGSGGMTRSTDLAYSRSRPRRGGSSS